MAMPRVKSLIDGKEYVTGRWFERHIKENGYNNIKEYYENFPELYNKIPICPYCDKKVSVIKYTTEKYCATCGNHICASKEKSKTQLSKSKKEKEETNKKRKKTVKEKYGTDFVTQSPEVIKKTKKTRATVTVSGLTVQELNTLAIQKAKEEKYGNRYYNNSEKISKTKQSHSIEKKDEINEKRRKTNIEKYGVGNVLMLPGIKSKVNAKNGKFKDYILPSGKIIKIRGYEPRAIDKLLETYDEKDIIISEGNNINQKIPTFTYKTEARQFFNYYPDIFIPSENKIIEVKSRWWYDADNRKGYESRIKNNHHKRNSVIDKGYCFEFWVYEKNGTLTII